MGVLHDPCHAFGDLRQYSSERTNIGQLDIHQPARVLFVGISTWFWLSPISYRFLIIYCFVF